MKSEPPFVGPTLGVHFNVPTKYFRTPPKGPCRDRPNLCPVLLVNLSFNEPSLQPGVVDLISSQSRFCFFQTDQPVSERKQYSSWLSFIAEAYYSQCSKDDGSSKKSMILIMTYPSSVYLDRTSSLVMMIFLKLSSMFLNDLVS